MRLSVVRRSLIVVLLIAGCGAPVAARPPDPTAASGHRSLAALIDAARHRIHGQRVARLEREVRDCVIHRGTDCSVDSAR
jgi:hypothetical protein